MPAIITLRLTVRGGLLLALWASLGVFLLALLLFVLFSAGWWVWAGAALISAALFVAFPWSYHFREVLVGPTELQVKAGHTFRHVRRLPVRYISGCSFVATPLQRALGICTVILYAPGSFAILVGLRKEEGEFLVDYLSGEVPGS